MNSLSALNAVQLSENFARLASLLGCALVVLPIVALFAPWQQFVAGEGFVSAYSPIDREQSIDAPIGGRIAQWHVREGSRVEAGAPLLEIRDVDPDLLQRLQRQRDALEAKVDALNEQLASYDEQTRNLRTTRDMLITTANYRLNMAQARSRSAAEALQAAQATQTAAVLQLQRLRRLLGEGIVSRRELELAERDAMLAQRAVNGAKASEQSAVADQRGAEADIARVESDAQSKVDSSVAAANKARSEMEESRASLAKLEVDLARQQSQTVHAPRAGTVLRLFGNPAGAVVKQSDPLLVIVPESNERGVELWVDGNDMPLISLGRPVRLQFEGWPAVQFVGWPSVAVGTFGGTVGFIDPSGNGKGKFRIMVVPDETKQAWPAAKFLRQGVRTRGWVLLSEVRLGWEIWRQLNGFPPVISLTEPNSGERPQDVARKRLK
jgi:membrane fusion protein, adhesin transport system